MQENRVQKEQICKRSKQRKQVMIKWGKKLIIRRCIGLGALLVMVVVSLLVSAGACGKSTNMEDALESADTSTLTVSTETDEETGDPIWGMGDPNNRVYPYSMMSTDWGVELYEQGWKYYEIPSSYKRAGGMFPEVAQVYLWSICREAGVDYYMVLALIERESGYKYDATGDRGNSKGLMQVYESYHLERMEALGVTDLYNPYSNMTVAVNILKEIQDKYLDSSGAHCVLMVYNMGEYGASKLWAEGVYSTDYTRQILQRAQELRQEIQDQ